MSIEVIKPGFLTTLQDAGRPGLAHLGVGRAGAFDGPAPRIANALAGNRRDACALELTLIGPTLRFGRDAWIAVTGAPIAFRVDGADAPMWAAVQIAAGSTVELGTTASGCRAYLAVSGGFEIDAVLGSRSTDVNAALGPLPRPLRTGDVLATGDASSGRRQAEPATGPAPPWSVDPRPWVDADCEQPLRLVPGSHLERLTSYSRKRLFSQTFHVHPDSNRVGIRLQGPELEWNSPVEMISEGCVPGLLQLPPSGQPIAFGPEGPVSGGYPRLGQIAAVDLPRLAQRRPGDAIRFRPCTLEEALHALRKRELALDALEAAIAARFQRPP